MDYLLVIDNATGESEMMSLDQAAFRTAIESNVIEAAIEAAGCCNSMDFTIRDVRPAEDVAA